MGTRVGYAARPGCGCKPRAAAGRLLLGRFDAFRWPLERGVAKPLHRPSDLHRPVEDLTERNHPADAVLRDGLEAGACHATAAAAIGVAAELARRDPPGQVGGIALRGLREDAFLWRGRWLLERIEHAVGRMQLGKLKPQLADLVDHTTAIVPREALA